MNRLSQEKQEIVLSALSEGNSIRAVERMTGHHRDTVMRLKHRTDDAENARIENKLRFDLVKYTASIKRKKREGLIFLQKHLLAIQEDIASDMRILTYLKKLLRK